MANELSDSDKTSMLYEFMEVSGMNDENRAKFYLQASSWSLQGALSAYFEEQAVDSDEPEEIHIPEKESPVLHETPTSKNDSGKPSKTSFAPGMPITLDALRRAGAQDDGSSSDDQQAFYAGGSQQSGQQVLGPSGNRKSKDELIKDMFRQAKLLGAEEEPDRNTLSSLPGYKLGESSDPSERVGPQTPSTSSSEEKPLTIKLYQNGFTISDDPNVLRMYDDESNQNFLLSIKRGEIPYELVKKYRTPDLPLVMKDVRHQEFTPERKVTAFTGRGEKLGGVSIKVTTSQSEQKSKEEQARAKVVVNNDSPVTNVMFRLADGRRLKATFNETHTVQDLYSFVDTASEASGSEFVLTLLPNRDLSDRNLTLKEANVLNAALQQKFMKAT